MKKIIIALLSTIFFSNVGYAASNGIVATFKGGEIKTEDLEKEFRAIWDKEPSLNSKKFDELPCPIQETIATLAVRTKLLELEAKNKNIRNNADYKEKIEQISKRLDQDMVLQDIVKNVKIDEAKLKTDYDDLVSKNKDKKEREVSHILVDSEKTANLMKTKLRKGEKFADLAKSHSLDEQNKHSGGVLGKVVQGQGLPKDFEDAVFALKVNEISEPIKSDAGYHVIKVLSEKPVPAPSFEQAKPILENKLKGEAVENYFNELYKKVDLKITLDCKKEDAKKPETPEPKK